MKLGVFLPISGRAAAPVLMDAARRAEALGYDSVWAADRIVIPWEIKTEYPYSADNVFIVPPDRPFLEPLTCLSFLAGGTTTITLGMSVLVLPYRHPLYWAKIATTLDHLSRGRFILGVGVGWMAEEFAALGAAFKDRGALSDEQLRVVKTLWEAERAGFDGRFYKFDNIAFYPKPLQQGGIPIWVGGEGEHAQRRAGRFGDAWFPYFVKITPRELAARFDNVCLPVDVTPDPVPQEPDRLRGTSEQLVVALRAFQRIGVQHVGLQFMVPSWPARLEQFERFAKETLPALRG